jgi:nitrate reductase gamma subunit
MGPLLALGVYAAFLFFVAGYLVRMLTWARQAPPRTLPGKTLSLPIFLKALLDVLLLRRLLRVNDILWIGEWVFHASLVVLFLRHLRYILDPVPALVAVMQIPAIVAAWLLPASLLYIGFMKIIIEKKAYISSYNFFLLGLISVSCASGLLMRYSFPADLAGIKHFTLGLVTFHPVTPPGSRLFLLHFSMFLVLLTSLPSHIFAAPLTMLEATQREEELPYLMHEK